MARALRAVEVGDAAPKRPLSISQAAKGADRRALLVALRDRVAATVESSKTLPRDLGTLSRRLLEIVKEIEAIDAEDGSDDVGTAAATPDEEWAAT